MNTQATNNNYLQFNVCSINDLLKLAKNPLACKVYCFLEKEISGYEMLVISKQCLADFFGISTVQIGKALQMIEESTDFCSKKVANVPVYFKNKPTQWQKKNGTKYCGCKANMIVSERELSNER